MSDEQRANAVKTIKKFQKIGASYLKEKNEYEKNHTAWRFWEHLCFNNETLAKQLSAFKVDSNIETHFINLPSPDQINSNIQSLNNRQKIILLPLMLIATMRSGRLFNNLCHCFNIHPQRLDPYAHTEQRRDLALIHISDKIEGWSKEQTSSQLEMTTVSLIKKPSKTSA